MNPEEIWNVHSVKLKYYILSKVSDTHEAEDILQEVALRVYSNISKMQDITHMEAWLYRIATNLMMDYFRRVKRSALTDDIDKATVPLAVDDGNYNHETANCLLKLAEYLPPTYKDAIIEGEYLGVKQNLLGQKWGLSFSGSKNRIQRARKKLKSTLLHCCEVKTDGLGNIIELINKGDAASKFSCMKC